MTLDHLLKAAALSQKLRDDFAVLANLFGPVRACELLAAEMVQAVAGDDDAEKRMVRLCRALYDDYTEEREVV